MLIIVLLIQYFSLMMKYCSSTSGACFILVETCSYFELLNMWKMFLVLNLFLFVEIMFLSR